MNPQEIKCKTCGETLSYDPMGTAKEITCPKCNEINPIPAVELSPATANAEPSNIENTKSAAPEGKKEDNLAAYMENNRQEFIPGTKDAISYASHIFDILTQKGHRLLGVYLVINTLFAAFVLSWFVGHLVHGGFALLIGVILYLVFLFAMLSPMGENYLRFSNGCGKIKRHEDLSLLTPIFTTVLTKARELDPSIPEDIQLFINSSKDPNAFALGRKTICVTRGILDPQNASQTELEAVLAHEFGHIAHKDTDVLILLTAGNIIVDLFFKFLRFLVLIFSWISAVLMGAAGAAMNNSADAMGGLGYGIGRLFGFILEKLIGLWYWFSDVCVMRASRKDEFKADEFSFNCGYGNELCSFLDRLEKRSHADEDPGPTDFFSFLRASHPPVDERITHMQEMGATYYDENR